MNNPDNWDLMDSLNRVGTVARNKFIEWWRHLNGSTDNPGYLYDMAIKLYFENRHPTPPVNDMAGLWDELDDFTAGIAPTELADDIRNTLEDMLYRHPRPSTPVEPKPSTDSQVDGLREEIEILSGAHISDRTGAYQEAVEWFQKELGDILSRHENKEAKHND